MVDKFNDLEFYEILKDLYIDVDYYKTSLVDFLAKVDQLCQKLFQLKAGFFIQGDLQRQTQYIPFNSCYMCWQERVKTLYNFRNQVGTSSTITKIMKNFTDCLPDHLLHPYFSIPDEDRVVVNNQFISFIYGFFPILDAMNQKQGMLFFACEKKAYRNYSSKIENQWKVLHFISKIFNKFLIFKLQAEQAENIKKAFLKALEAKDIYSFMHADFVTKYVKHIAFMALKDRDSEIKQEDIDNLILAAQLHDIGKISIPDGILNKPGKVTEVEYQEIKRHPFYAYKLLDMVNVNSEVLRLITNHHERCDGKGYYHKSIREMDLPLSILILADCFDAMTSWRYYKSKDKILSLHEALETLKQENTENGTSTTPCLILPKSLELLEKCLEENINQWEVESQERNNSLEELALNWNKSFREIPLYCQHFPNKKCLCPSA